VAAAPVDDDAQLAAVEPAPLECLAEPGEQEQSPRAHLALADVEIDAHVGPQRKLLGHLDHRAAAEPQRRRHRQRAAEDLGVAQ